MILSNHSSCWSTHPWTLSPLIRDRKYVAFFIGFLAMVESLLRRMYLLNSARKYSVLLLSPSNGVGTLPSSLSGFRGFSSSSSSSLKKWSFFFAQGFLGGSPLGVCDENIVLIGTACGWSSE